MVYIISTPMFIMDNWEYALKFIKLVLEIAKIIFDLFVSKKKKNKHKNKNNRKLH